ncbi:ankyrin repeat domain-containing protein [Acinetobacter sp. MD2(2019)]|uniref:ankyrin repeat domain-containing protein n=1 Tax=Acinetobacter sp. MD2(2019) TaxID=2605273 RepID=UPI002D1F42A7|nr:ankyrin repeat domain-containing protein [Acinetobacter sp. MD2(2019)]MEB3753136.1 ankyrin repeat domain-containing protein [Acinetobacter sp. MD2(2019)]
MLTTQQLELIQAIEQLDLASVKALLAEGLDPNFLEPEKGPPISIICDVLFQWWQPIYDGYEAGQPIPEAEKQQSLLVYLDIIDALIAANANVHLWDSEEFFGPLWDAASAACVPAVQRLLAQNVNPNTLDDEGMTVLSSISQLMYECDFDEIDWDETWPEEKQTLQLLREHGAKMTKELDL